MLDGNSQNCRAKKFLYNTGCMVWVSDHPITRSPDIQVLIYDSRFERYLCSNLYF